MSQVGARGVAVTTQRSAQPYEFAYDHVSGALGSQEDLFMCKCMFHRLHALVRSQCCCVHGPALMAAVLVLLLVSNKGLDGLGAVCCKTALARFDAPLSAT